MTSTRPRVDPWGAPRPVLQVGQLIRFPGGRVYVVGLVNESRARVHPLTPQTRTITVPHRDDFSKSKRGRRMVEKEVEETGDPIDITTSVVLDSVDVGDLTEAEFKRLTRYIEDGGEFNVE